MNGELTLLFARLMSLVLTMIFALQANSQTPPPSTNSAPIPMDQLGAVATKQYQGDGLILSWPAPATGFGLQETSEPTQSVSWTNSSLPVITTNDQNQVSVAPTNRTQFFRLRLN